MNIILVVNTIKLFSIKILLYVVVYIIVGIRKSYSITNDLIDIIRIKLN